MAATRLHRADIWPKAPPRGPKCPGTGRRQKSREVTAWTGGLLPGILVREQTGKHRGWLGPAPPGLSTIVPSAGPHRRTAQPVTPVACPLLPIFTIHAQHLARAARPEQRCAAHPAHRATDRISAFIGHNDSPFRRRTASLRFGSLHPYNAPGRRPDTGPGPKFHRARDFSARIQVVLRPV